MTSSSSTSGARRIVYEFFRRLGIANDIDGWLALLSPEICVDTPFVPAGEARHFSGLKEIEERFADARRPMQSLEFLDVEVLATEDPERWVATCRSVGMLQDGRHYRNIYCWIFQIRDERIVWWCEYYDPNELAAVRH